MPELKLTRQVEHVMTMEAIRLDELTQMVKLATPYRDPDFNLRFHSWGLKYDKETGDLSRMARIEFKTVGRGQSPMTEECEDCAGEGCTLCGYRGEIIRMV